MRLKKLKLGFRNYIRNLAKLKYRETVMSFALLLVILFSILFFPGIDNITIGLQSGIDSKLIILFFLIAIFAGIIKGTIGFGYALITTPIFASVIDPTVAVVVLAIPPWMLNVFQIGDTNTGVEYIKNEWPLIILALIGSFIGVFFLSTFRTGPIIPFIMGVLIFGYVVYEIVKKFVVIEKAHNPIALGGVGFLEGFFLAAANLGPLLPAYLHTFERDTERYVGGLSMVFTFVFTERILQMLWNGLMTPYLLWLGSSIAVVTILGLLFGTYLRRLEINEKKFNWIVITLLFIISLNIFYKTIPILFNI